MIPLTTQTLVLPTRKPLSSVSTALPAVAVLVTQASLSCTEALYDTELVRRFKSGNEPAFLEIMARYRTKILATATSLLHNRSDAEEITQDTFIRAHQGLTQFRGDSSLSTWLHRIAINLAHNRYWYYFRRCRHQTLSLDFPLGEDGDATFADVLADSAPGPASNAVSSEFSALVAACMEQLEPHHRKILSLHLLRHSYEEIATTLHLSISTVKSRLTRARLKLRRSLVKACPESEGTLMADYWLRQT